MNITQISLINLFLFLTSFAFSQPQNNPPNPPVKALNNYVQFTNESIHGLMVVHRLLENFNQEVNSYVDLQSNQLNFFANKDLPKNIFLDEEDWFYKTSPYEWYNITKAESRFLKPEEAKILNRHLEKIKKIIDRVNQMRFEWESFIKNNDLQKEENQTEIYRRMENGVDLYENFYLEKEALRKSLKKIYQKNYFVQKEYKSLGVPVLIKIHNNILPILKSMRYEVTGSLPVYTKRLEENIDELNSIVNIHSRYKMAKAAAKDFLVNLKKYQGGGGFDNKYKLYGKSYFYHNVELVAAFNNYSGRMMRATNEMIAFESNNQLFLVEEPHIFKVIYPKKEIQRVENQPVIEDVPEEINDRNVVMRQQNIVVDKKEFTLQIFDNKQVDGDIISINFNGKWIIENQKLSKNPFKFKVKLNPKGENYILLHAENLGKVPPNTAALVYYYKGKRQQVVLNSNLNESEMIKFEFDESK